MAKALIFSDAGGSLQEVSGVIIRKSGSSEGTGSEQTIAHGLGATPKRVMIFCQESPATAAVTIRTANSTNFYATVTSGESYAWIAEVW